MSAKPIRFSRHAVFEMKRRGISRSMVASVIRKPGQVIPSKMGRAIYQSIIGRARNLLVRIIVKEDDDAYHVVTAYKTSKVEKYWSEE